MSSYPQEGEKTVPVHGQRTIWGKRGKSRLYLQSPHVGFMKEKTIFAKFLQT